MGVISDDNPYQLPDGLMFSFPVIIEHGEWKIVDGLIISKSAREKLTLTANELLEERRMALNI